MKSENVPTVPSAKFASERLNETLDWLVGVSDAMDEVTALTDEEQDPELLSKINTQAQLGRQHLANAFAIIRMTILFFDVEARARIAALFGDDGEDRKPN